MTSSIDRATTEAPSFDGFEPARWLPLREQPQDDSGVFHVAPGSYELQAASYCLHAGTHGPGRGDGYLYAPLEGSRSSVIRAILQGSVRHPELRQQDIQVLLWAILARTPLDQMPRRAQIAATSLLTPQQLLELGVGSFSVMTPGIWDGGGPAMPPATARVFQAEARLRQLFARADTPYAEFVLSDLDQMLIYINTLSRERTFITFQGEVISRKEEEAFLRRALDKTAHKTAAMIGIYKEDELIGLASVELRVRTERHVGDLGISIAKEYPGQGLGKQLMEKILETAKLELPGLKIVSLGVFATNDLDEDVC